MGKYFVLNEELQLIKGPYDSWLQADATLGENDFIVKLCPKENQLGAPNVYPFSTEEYDDGEEG